MLFKKKPSLEPSFIIFSLITLALIISIGVTLLRFFSPGSVAVDEPQPDDIYSVLVSGPAGELVEATSEAQVTTQYRSHMWEVFASLSTMQQGTEASDFVSGVVAELLATRVPKAYLDAHLQVLLRVQALGEHVSLPTDAELVEGAAGTEPAERQNTELVERVEAIFSEELDFIRS